jgi:ribosome-binding factor A
MAHDYSRTRRVGDQIQRELALIIQQEVKDPRVGMVTITSVEVSREYEHAKVYITVLGDEAVAKTTLEGLDKASGFLRRELAHRLKLRVTPKLHFHYDHSLEDGMRLSSLIDAAVASDNIEDKAEDAE